MTGRQSAVDFSNEGEPDDSASSHGVETTRRSNVAAGLEVTDKNGEVAFHEIVTGSFVIGRSPSCNLIVNDTKTSRKHAAIKQLEVGYTIEDLGSSNGTLVNGQKISGVISLKVGDKIVVGKQHFVFKISLAE